MNHTRLWVLLMLVAGPLAAGPSLAQGPLRVDSAKVATVHRLLALSGAVSTMLETTNAMISTQRVANPQIPAAFWDAFRVRSHEMAPKLIDSLVPVYASRFTQAELDALVRFYESPVGKHLTEVQPQIVQESFEIGRRWGMQLGREIGDSLRAAGVIH